MKNVLFGALFALFCFALLELGSAAVYRVQFGSWYSYSAQQEKALKLAGLDAHEQMDGEVNTRTPSGQRGDRYFLHPFSGFTATPHVPGEYNAFGYRGPSPLAPRAPDQLLVGVAGGSVAAQVRRFAGDVLKEELERVYPDKEVVLTSLALGGMKQPQQLMTLAYMLTLGAKFDVIINIDGYNEGVLSLRENHRNGVAPFFPRTWHVYAAQGLDLDRVLTIGRLATMREEQVNLARLASGPVGFSVFAGTAWEVLNNRKATEIFRSERLIANYQRADGKQPPHIAGPIRDYGDADALDNLVVDVWLNASRQMAALARANGIEYYHFLQPNQYYAGSKPLTQNEQALLLPEDHPGNQITQRIYPKLVAGIARLAEEPDIAAFDVTQVYSGNEETLYVDSCCHMNNEGYAILARAMVEQIALAKAE